MKTEVRTDGIYLQFFPLYSRTVALSDIAAYEVRQYSPIVEYGGWGIRFGTQRKRVYTMSGNMGVELELTDETRLLVGSQRPEELARVIGTAKASS